MVIPAKKNDLQFKSHAVRAHCVFGTYRYPENVKKDYTLNINILKLMERFYPASENYKKTACNIIYLNMISVEFRSLIYTSLITVTKILFFQFSKGKTEIKVVTNDGRRSKAAIFTCA